MEKPGEKLTQTRRGPRRSSWFSSLLRLASGEALEKLTAPYSKTLQRARKRGRASAIRPDICICIVVVFKEDLPELWTMGDPIHIYTLKEGVALIHAYPSHLYDLPSCRIEAPKDCALPAVLARDIDRSHLAS